MPNWTILKTTWVAFIEQDFEIKSDVAKILLFHSGNWKIVITYDKWNRSLKMNNVISMK